MDKKLVTIIILSVTTFALLMTTIFFAMTAAVEAKNFDDQVDVSRDLVRSYESLTMFDYEESAKYLDRAHKLQDEILERNGIDSL